MSEPTSKTPSSAALYPITKRPRVNNSKIEELLKRARAKEAKLAAREKLKTENQNHGTESKSPGNGLEGKGHEGTGQESPNQSDGSASAGQVQAEQHQGLIKRVEELEKVSDLHTKTIGVLQAILETLIPKEVDDHGRPEEHETTRPSSRDGGRPPSGRHEGTGAVSEGVSDSAGSEETAALHEADSDGKGEVIQTGPAAKANKPRRKSTRGTVRKEFNDDVPVIPRGKPGLDRLSGRRSKEATAASSKVKLTGQGGRTVSL